MAKSIKLGSDTYLDTSGITHGDDHTLLSEMLSTVTMYHKNTQGAYATVTINFSGNRYTGLAFALSNTGQSAVYAVSFKTAVQNTATKLAGGTTAVTVNTDGSISTSLPAWSELFIFVVTDVGSFT